MIRKLIVYISVVIVLCCICIGGAYTDNSTVTIDAGPLKINALVSETATLFHVVDRISKWDEPSSKYYIQYFLGANAQLSEEDKRLLAQHTSIRKKYNNDQINQMLYTPDNLDSALDKAVKKKILTEQEAKTEKTVLLHFKPRVDKLVEQEKQTITKFSAELSAKKPEIGSFAETVSRFVGGSKLDIQLYIIPNPNINSTGYGYSGDIFMVEVSDVQKSYQWLLRNLFFAFAFGKCSAIADAASPEAKTGLNAGMLMQGMAFAISPGMLNGGDSDQLAEQSASFLSDSSSLNNSYALFNIYGLALRPILKEALYSKPQTLEQFLPKAVDAWRVMVELNKTRSTQKPSEGHNYKHDYKKDMNHSIFVFGSCDRELFTEDLRKSTDKHLFGRNHSAETYKDMLDNNSKPGDTIVLLVSLDSAERVPTEFLDLMPKPWSEVESKLNQGSVVVEQGKAREMSVFLISAPTHNQMCKEFQRLIAEKKL